MFAYVYNFNMQGASKVGALVVIFAALLYGAFSLFGQNFLAKPHVRTYYAEFKDAGGLAPGAKVLMAGVKIGSVTNIQLVDPKLAKLTLVIDESAPIYQGSTAVISSSLTGLGETPLTIVPPEKMVGGQLPNGSTISGLKTNPVEDLLPNSKATMSEVTNTLIAVRKLLDDQKLRGNVNNLLTTTTLTLQRFGALADHANALMVQNNSTIKGAMAQAYGAISNVNKATELVTKLLQSGKYQDQALSIMKSLNKTADKADQLVADIDKFITDPKIRDPLNTTAANIAAITTTSKEIATNTAEITKNGAVISKKAIDLTDKANEIAQEAKELLGKLKGMFDKTGSVKPFTVSATMDVIHEQDPRHWRTDVNFSMPLSDTTIHVGLWDAFESNKINAQLGKQFSNGELRYGIYASKPGVGVDYRLAPGLGLRADLFDINDPRFDLKARLELSHGVIGWVGVDRLFKRNTPSFGIGIIK